MANKWEIEEYWLSRAFAWAWPSIWCAGLMYSMHFIESLKAQGGWRGILAIILTVAGKSLYEFLKKKANAAIVPILVLVLACAATAALPAAPPALGICVPATIIKVHDGDTATDVVIEIHCQVRYLDCWARELSEPGGKEAADSAKIAEGKHGRLYIPAESASLAGLFTFGRLLGEFWPDGADESESQRQVRLGFAGKTKKLEPKK